jgi:hypothetical protein
VELAVLEVRLVLEERGMSGQGGPTVRVYDAQGKRELLRFDCFARGAHWHIDPGGEDRRSDMPDGPPSIEFTLRQLEHEIDTLLLRAGHKTKELLASSAQWAKALDQVKAWLKSDRRA